MKRIDPTAQANLAQLRDHTAVSSRNTSNGDLLHELYALFSPLAEINPELIREAISVENRLHNNSYEMLRQLGEQTRYILRPFIALTTENIEEHLHGDINAFGTQHTSSNLGNLRRQLGNFVNARHTIR